MSDTTINPEEPFARALLGRLEFDADIRRIVEKHGALAVIRAIQDMVDREEQRRADEHAKHRREFEAQMRAEQFPPGGLYDLSSLPGVKGVPR